MEIKISDVPNASRLRTPKSKILEVGEKYLHFSKTTKNAKDFLEVLKIIRILEPQNFQFWRLKKTSQTLRVWSAKIFNFCKLRFSEPFENQRFSKARNCQNL
ncbi:hypothetical protein A9507_06320 [Methanobacterium sp. A39]|uniref:Uncharacterized protein n=1 Tax=Methanobacterium bryantii TaxID=2161 RepID=A0A2A2H2F8_METBR|nr:hypothetical protein A9507_06320 [Methanobacterium sp. A39]PAV03572.1 hypothetical protein ASJ80_01055 [Methanobacterium bryantii]